MPTDGPSRGFDPKRNKPSDSAPSLWRYAGMGLDLAAAVGGFTLIGWLVDKYTGRFPRYTVVGAVLGLVGGMYNLIRQSLNFTRSMREDQPDDRKGPPRSDGP